MARLFGTDGVRGVANTELTPELAFWLGRAGAYVLASAIHKPKILVGRDTRISGYMLESALVAGIMSMGADAVVVGVIPTPGIAFLTRYYSCDAGVMISASHNPVEDNGIKFFDSQGYKLPDALEDKIEEIITTKAELPLPTGTDIGRIITVKNPARDYIDFLKQTTDVSFEGIKVVMDCANGACSEIAPTLFSELGATVIPFYNDPDGTNINKNCGSTHASRVCSLVVEQDADIGLAFDGDADRLIAADERGIEMDGDHIMAICAKMLKDENKLANNTVVATVMSNMGLDVGLNKLGINIAKTSVGDRYVLEYMVKNSCNLGGEKSGHVIFLDYNTTGDGMLSAIQLLRARVKYGKKLSELAKVMQNMPQVLVNVIVDKNKKDAYQTDEEVSAAIAKAEQSLKGRGRVLVRASGTEPLLRIMLEGPGKEEINQYALTIAQAMVKNLNGVIKQ